MLLRVAAVAVILLLSIMVANAETPDANLITRWTCPIGTAGTEIAFDITAVSPAITGTVSGKNSNPKYPPQWGPVHIGSDPGMVRAVPSGNGIDFTMPTGTTYSNFRISRNDAVVDFKSALERDSRALTCAKK